MGYVVGLTTSIALCCLGSFVVAVGGFEYVVLDLGNGILGDGFILLMVSSVNSISGAI